MKVSIITISFNSASTIEATIQSVVGQDYGNVEYIIIDGGSKDDTLNVIEKYKSQIAKTISEKDDGLYDALNKGISMATGEVIGLLHSDDVFANNTVISDVVKQFEKHKEAMLLYADLIFIDRINESKIKRLWKSGHYREGAFQNGWMPPHPTLFVKREVYQQYGFFNTELQYSADYELMLRFIHKHKLKLIYLPQVIVKMRMGGASNSTIMNKVKANIEDRKAWLMNGLNPSAFFMFRKPLRKVMQYFMRSV